ncbi:MAG: YARHG domain-containing protein [Clostridia bacterium]|nr:YARHG domain-containing protein [Clostridia bacterium]
MKKKFFVLLMMLALLLSLCSCRMIGKSVARLIPALNNKASVSDSVAKPDQEQNTPETDAEEKAPEAEVVPQPQPESEPEPAPESSDFVFADSSERLITQAEAAERFTELANAYSPSGKPAQDAVNEIYARHGYTFSTQKILDYYKSKSWYTPRADFSESELNEIEKANIALFQSLK